MQSPRGKHVPAEHHNGERHARPHEGGISAHMKEFTHRASTVLSQEASRSRSRISPRSRTSSIAPKYSVKPSSIVSKGQSMPPAIEGLPSLVSVEAWCKVFHQFTE